MDLALPLAFDMLTSFPSQVAVVAPLHSVMYVAIRLMTPLDLIAL